VFVFEDDRERDLSRLNGARRFLIGVGDHYLIAPLEQTRSPRRFTADDNRTGGDQPRGLSSGKLELIGEEAVEPFGRLAEDRERK
jgi:hypothetical protein